MTLPASLYDASSSPPQLIAHIRLQTTRRAIHTTVDHKLDQDWPTRVEGGGALEMRATAEGVVADLSWIATLYARQGAFQTAPYLITLQDGDSHSGSFVIDTLEEFLPQQDADGRRRFRLVLLSSGPIVYTPA